MFAKDRIEWLERRAKDPRERAMKNVHTCKDIRQGILESLEEEIVGVRQRHGEPNSEKQCGLWLWHIIQYLAIPRPDFSTYG